jgi:hypothetical protein
MDLDRNYGFSILKGIFKIFGDVETENVAKTNDVEL